VKALGEIVWVRSNPLAAWVVLIRQPKKQRKAMTFAGKKRQAKKDQVHAKREKEPWLLVASLSLLGRPAKQIIKIYRTRIAN
jgi:hypothetical protein